MNSGKQTGNLDGRRILVGPQEIAGFTSRIALALARDGADVLFFNGQDHVFNPHLVESKNLRRLFGPAIGVASRWRARRGPAAIVGALLAGVVKILAFVKACVWARTIVMIGGKGFFGGALEYAFLRLLGKRVIHVFVGTASRPRYQSGYAKSVLKDGRVNQKELKRLAKRTRRQAARIRGISRNASLVIENPLCGHFHEKAFVNLFKLGIPLDVATLEKKPRLSENTPQRAEGKIRVLHCPSRPEIKGSARIQTVLEKLIREGVPIEFRQLTGVPHAQLLYEITASDFVVDQLYSDSPMAGFAAEASAFGKAAVVGGYGWKLFGEYLRPEEIPPTAMCHPDELEKLIRALALDSVHRDAFGAKARAFLENQWSEAGFAEHFARVVTGDIPSDWLVRPEQVRYLHGLGLEENETRTIIGALVEKFGASALQLDHVPELREQMVSFGKENPSAG